MRLNDRVLGGLDTFPIKSSIYPIDFLTGIYQSYFESVNKPREWSITDSNVFFKLTLSVLYFVHTL